MNWWRHIAASELRKILAYRVDFWVTFLGQTFVQLFIARALWQNIFESTGSTVMEGYTLPMMTLYFLIVPIGNRILQGESMGFLSREIYDGTFNRYLIYPLSFFHYKTLTYLTYSFFYSIQLMLIFTIYQIFFDGGLSLEEFQSLLIGIVIFMIAAFTYMNMNMMVELLALWADNIWSLAVMLRFFCYFLGGSFVPVAFFPEWLKDSLFLTPFPYLVSLPIRTVMGLTTWSEIGTGILILLIWGIIIRGFSHLMWNKGQFRYNGVGI